MDGLQRLCSLSEKRLWRFSTRLNAEELKFFLTAALKSILLYLQTIPRILVGQLLAAHLDGAGMGNGGDVTQKSWGGRPG